MAKRAGKKNRRILATELLRVPATAGYPGIPVARIVPFKGYPYRVMDDDRMHELVENILENGMVTPVIVRETGTDTYELISGYRRLFAAKQIGLEEVPAVIRELSDDEAVLAVVDSNLHREGLLPSEKAFACRMRYEVMRKKAYRPLLKKISRSDRRCQADIVLAEALGESRHQIHRYLRLTHLIPAILELVDRKAVALSTGVEIFFLDHPVQKMLYDYMLENDICKKYQVSAVRDYLRENDMITKQELIRILNESAPVYLDNTFQKIVLTKYKLREYFPIYYTKSQMENVLLGLLEEWKKENN